MILDGENINTELKLASKSLPKNLFETVCAFLNTIGGTIILGVNDKREIIGIEKEYIDSLKKDFTSQCNNEEIISPSIFCELKEIEIDGHTLLYANIEKSKSVHNQKNKIYEEDRVYPTIDIETEINHDLIERARRLANSNVNKRHPWMDMTDLELLKSAGLYKQDIITKEEGITLAGIMLFGYE